MLLSMAITQIQFTCANLLYLITFPSIAYFAFTTYIIKFVSCYINQIGSVSGVMYKHS